MTAASGPAPAPGPKATPQTVFDLLFGSDRAVDAVEQALEGRTGDSIRKTLGRLPSKLQQPMNKQLAAAIADLLQPRLDDMLIEGWCKYDDLVAAARSTTDAPGRNEKVDLVSHTVTCAARPSIDLFIDGVRRGRLQLVLKVVVDIDAVTAVVEAGRIVALRSGHAVFRARLDVEGVELESSDVPVDVGLILTLGAGIPLLPTT